MQRRIGFNAFDDQLGQRVWAHEPESSAGLRALVWLLGWLPIDSQL